MLHVEHVSVTLGGRKVLQDVSFSLPAGAFCGLIGANGSGKTTLLRSILGLRTPDSGRISVNGAQGRAALASLGYVPQKTMLDPELPLRARDLVSLGLDGNRLGLPFPSAAKTRLVDKMLHEVDAQDFADQRVGRLSGGQQQRVLIAHALVRQPKILLLDEPLANLDLRSVAEIVALLHRLVAQQNICVLLSAHDMNPLLPVMDRIVYLANGKAVSGTTGEVVRTSVLSALYGYHIDVIRVHGRVLVVAGHEQEAEIGPHHAAHVTEIP